MVNNAEVHISSLGQNYEPKNLKREFIRFGQFGKAVNVPVNI